MIQYTVHACCLVPVTRYYFPAIRSRPAGIRDKSLQGARLTANRKCSGTWGQMIVPALEVIGRDASINGLQSHQMKRCICSSRAKLHLPTVQTEPDHSPVRTLPSITGIKLDLDKCKAADAVYAKTNLDSALFGLCHIVGFDAGDSWKRLHARGHEAIGTADFSLQTSNADLNCDVTYPIQRKCDTQESS